MFRIAVIGLTGLLATACASTSGYILVPMDTDTIETRYERGFATVTSHRENSSVQIYPAGAEHNRRLTFDVAVVNHGGDPVNFGTENLALIIGEDRYRMYTREELAEEARRYAANQRAAAVVAGILVAYAAYELADSSGGGYVSTPYGVTTYGYNYFDAGAAAVGILGAAAGTAIAVDAINGELDNALGQLNGGALATTTVDPAHVYGGRVQALPFPETDPPPAVVELEVEFGGEVHRFPFNMFEGPANLTPYSSGLQTGNAQQVGKPN
jgi:hypothetical protein